MLSGTQTVSQQVDLNMHLPKTRFMLNSCAKVSPVFVEGKTLEESESYVYHGNKIARDFNSHSVIRIVIVHGWAAFRKVYSITKTST